MTRLPARRSTLTAAAAVLLGLAAYASFPLVSSRSGSPDPEPVILATGDTGGVPDAYGQELAAIGQTDLGPIQTQVTAGSVENLSRLNQGRAAFAFATADVVEEYLPDLTSIRAVARLHDSFVQLIVRAELPVRTPADLRGRRVSVGRPGSGTSLVADRILLQAGLKDPDADIERFELSLSEAVAALRWERIDAFFVSDGLKTPAVARLAEQTPIRVVDLGEIAVQLRAKHGSAYHVGNVPARSYPGMAGPITTIAMPTFLLTTDDTSPDVVERMTRLLFDSAPAIATRIPAIGQVDRHAAIFTGTVELHEGARAYYRSTKVAA